MPPISMVFLAINRARKSEDEARCLNDTARDGEERSKKDQQMNWTKGLFRLWIAVSLLWVILFLIDRFSDNIPSFVELQQQSQNPTQFVALVIGPPIALLVLGLGGWWIIAGFRAPRRKRWGEKDRPY
jgi:hypothetical protein